MHDKARKDRAAAGERHGMAKLTLKQVQAILDLRGSGLTQQEIGKKFGVCQAHVSDLLSGRRKSWRTQRALLDALKSHLKTKKRAA